jgi:hypothetical protein
MEIKLQLATVAKREIGVMAGATAIGSCVTCTTSDLLVDYMLVEQQ